MKYKPILIFLAVLVLIGIAYGRLKRREPSQPDITPTATIEAFSSPSPVVESPAPTPSPTPSLEKKLFLEPIQEFKQRITKKSFGTYVTPENSPVQSERFSGYHTGVDVEFGDVGGDVPVYAIANGRVVSARTVNGYGGVAILQIKINNQDATVLYGHLDPATLPADGASITSRQRVGILGDGGTTETDGERKHLHLAIRKGNTVDFRGYVQNKDALSGWYDPLIFY